ncbi:MAG: ECF-type sigma factor [Planctomycetota bacterium]
MTVDQPDPNSMRSDAASDALFSELQNELRSVARSVFTGERSGHTLQPTALVNETWLKIGRRADLAQNKAHFFAIAARVMRQILADHARGKLTAKRGGQKRRVTFVDGEMGRSDSSFDAFAFHDALERLSAINTRYAEVTELRLLGSLTVPEISEMIGVSENTVKRDWQASQAWLARELADS